MLRIMMVVATFLLILGSGNWANAAWKVLVIESYHHDYAWDASYNNALAEALGPEYALSYFEMDTKRLPADQHQGKADEAWQAYLTLQPDLVVLGDDASMKFLAQRFAGTTTPVVYLGINNNPRNYLSGNVVNFTGIMERPLLRRSVAYIESLIPSTKKVLILFDADLTAQIVKKESFEDKDSIVIGDIRLDIKLLGDLQSWHDTVAGARSQYDAVVVGLYQTVKDGEGRPVDPETIVNWVSDNSPVPPFAFWDFAVGPQRSIGGYVLRGREMGWSAADLIKKILAEGNAPKEIRPIYNDNGAFLFSATQLRKWQMNLPEDIRSVAEILE